MFNSFNCQIFFEIKLIIWDITCVAKLQHELEQCCSKWFHSSQQFDSHIINLQQWAVLCYQKIMRENNWKCRHIYILVYHKIDVHPIIYDVNRYCSKISQLLTLVPTLSLYIMLDHIDTKIGNDQDTVRIQRSKQMPGHLHPLINRRINDLDKEWAKKKNYFQ